jgi:hypothetical protein
MATVFSADYVRARWAYSELRSPRQGHRYTGRVQDLKDKSTQGVAFHALSQDELNQLMRLFNDIRGPEFNMYLGETGFVLTHWTKDQLGMVTILPSYKFRLLARGVAVATFKQWA